MEAVTSAPNRAAKRAEKQVQWIARQKRLAAMKEQATKPEPKKHVPQAAPARVKTEPVKLRDEAKLVVIFGLPARLVPKGIQVLNKCGGQSDVSQQDQDADELQSDQRFSVASLDVTGLLARCSVETPVVSRNHKGYCMVYINAAVCIGSTKQGLNEWGNGVYGKFIQENLEKTYGRIVASVDAAGKIWIKLRKPTTDMAKEKVRFAIAR